MICQEKPSKGKRGDEYVCYCKKCGTTAYGKTPEEAIDSFNVLHGQSLRGAGSLPLYMASRIPDIMTISAPFVSSDKPAFNRMIKKNIRYAMSQKGKAWDAVWATEEGALSVIAALEESFILGATLDDMGYLIPYNGHVEFQPRVEAFIFAVTTGKNAPFENIEIEAIFEGDDVEISREDGNFHILFKSMENRTDVIKSVAVYGLERKSGKIKGEIYSADRLMRKATEHSASYQTYTNQISQIERARKENKILLDNGSEYIEVTAIGKNGPYKRKIYISGVSSPYSDADKPEMLKKTAGKSFLSPYIKVRNSEAAYSEINEDDDLDDILSNAMDKGMESLTKEESVAEMASKSIQHGEFY